MFNFNFGKKKPDKKKIIIISILLYSIIATLSQCSGVSENVLWDLLDEIQRKYFPQTIINEIIIQDPNKVERRVHRDVDNAIKEYERLTKNSEPPIITLPKFIESPLNKNLCYTEECQSLGGEMRLCAPWIDTCKDTSETGQRYLPENQNSVNVSEWLRNEPLEP
jgi:hypothetical protein